MSPVLCPVCKKKLAERLDGTLVIVCRGCKHESTITTA